MHLDYVHVIAFVKRIVINIGAHVSLLIVTPLGICQEVGWFSHMTVLVQVSQGITKLFCIQVVPVCVTPSSA